MKAFAALPLRFKREALDIKIFVLLCFGAVGAIIWTFPLAGRANNGHCDAWYYFGPMVAPWLVMPPYGRVMMSAVFAPLGLIGGLKNLEILYFALISVAVLLCSYLASRKLFGPVPAAAASFFVGLCELTIASNSSTYSGPPMMYGALALFLVCAAATSATLTARAASSFGAGVFLAFAANCHIATLAAYGPFCLIAALAPVGSRQAVQSRLAVSGLAGLLGFLTGIALTCALAWWLYGDFSIALVQVASTLQFFKASPTLLESYLLPGWWRNNGVTPLLILMVGSVLALIVCRDRKSKHVTLAIVGSLSFFLAYALALSGKTIWMMWSFYAVWFILPISITIAATLDSLWNRQDVEREWLAVVAIGCIFTVMFVAWPLQVDLSWIWQLAMAIAAAAILLVGAVLRRTRTIVFISLAFFLLPAYAVTSQVHTGYGHGFRTDRSDHARHEYAIAKQALRFIAEQYDDKGPPVVWISREASQSLVLPIFRSLARCGFEQNFPDSLPSPTLQWQGVPASRRELVLLLDQKESPERGAAAIAQLGLQLVDTKERTLTSGEWSIKVAIGRLVGK